MLAPGIQGFVVLGPYKREYASYLCIINKGRSSLGWWTKKARTFCRKWKHD